MAKINQRQMTVLFSTVGPVEQLLEFRTREVVALAQDNVREIMRNFQGNIESILDDIDYEIIVEGTTIEAIVGIRANDKIAQYLADKEDREQVWLLPAVEQVFD